MRRPFFSSFSIVLMLTIILISPISSYGHGDGGGGNDIATSTNNVAPSGFTSFGSGPFAYHVVEQHDHGQSGHKEPIADPHNTVNSDLNALGTLAVFGGGLAVSYATAGYPLAVQMLASGGYAVTVGSNAAQDITIAAIPLPSFIQAMLGLLASPIREAMPESERSAGPTVAPHMPPANK